MSEIYGDSVTIEKNFTAGTEISSGTTYAAGDVVGVIQTLPASVGATNSFSAGGGGRETGGLFLQSVTIAEKSAQNSGFIVMFFDSAVTAAADNAANAFTDAALASSCIGFVEITSSVTCATNQVYGKNNIGLQMKPAASGSVYAVAVAAGTPDYADSGLTFKYAFSRDS